MSEVCNVRPFRINDMKETGKVLHSAFEDDELVNGRLLTKEQFSRRGANIFEWSLYLNQPHKMTDVIQHEDGNVIASAIWETPKPTAAVTSAVTFRSIKIAFRLFTTFGWGTSSRLFGFEKILQKKRAAYAPTAFHLSILGTNSSYQNMGVGSKLIKAGLDRADEINVPCYLESSNPKNVPFYKRHGFETVEIYKHYGDDGPITTLMLRPAQNKKFAVE